VTRHWIGHVPVDALTRVQALARIAELVAARAGGTVFTPNVDHVVLAEDDVAFRTAYAATRLSLVDGMPVLWACRALGQPVPEKISGADLVAPLLAMAAERGWRVFLLGSTPEVLARVDALMRVRCPNLQLVGNASPDVDMRAPAETRRPVWECVAAARPDLVLIALGSPKGELWAHEARDVLRPAVLLGIGAALDFLTGAARRAPGWVSRLGLEWLYRLLHEPRRLWRRYLVRDPRFVLIFLRQWRGRGRAGAQRPGSR
jgi:N-acetylglucosaminyldiphosphoundecaprenol N-acetyl-beta-D-mannosaminyltransferase